MLEGFAFPIKYLFGLESPTWRHYTSGRINVCTWDASPSNIPRQKGVTCTRRRNCPMYGIQRGECKSQTNNLPHVIRKNGRQILAASLFHEFVQLMTMLLPRSFSSTLQRGMVFRGNAIYIYTRIYKGVIMCNRWIVGNQNRMALPTSKSWSTQLELQNLRIYRILPCTLQAVETRGVCVALQGSQKNLLKLRATKHKHYWQVKLRGGKTKQMALLMDREK